MSQPWTSRIGGGSFSCSSEVDDWPTADYGILDGEQDGSRSVEQIPKGDLDKFSPRNGSKLRDTPNLKKAGVSAGARLRSLLGGLQDKRRFSSGSSSSNASRGD